MRMPHPEKAGWPSNVCATRRACSSLAMPVNRHCPAFDVDKTVAQANPDDYDALVLPGGVMNPDKLRTD